MTRGGIRVGAGRKPLGLNRNKFIIYVDDAEQVAIKSLVESMRGNESSVLESNVNKVHNNQIELDALKLKHDDEIVLINEKHEREINSLNDRFFMKIRSMEIWCKGEVTASSDSHRQELHAIELKCDNVLFELMTLQAKYDNELSILKSNNNTGIVVGTGDTIPAPIAKKISKDFNPIPWEQIIEIIVNKKSSGMTSKATAEHLNSMGYKNQRGKEFSVDVIDKTYKNNR